MDKLVAWDPSNFMLRHNLTHYEEEDPQDKSCLWYPTQLFARPMDRMVAEAVQIKDAMELSQQAEGRHIILNGKTEYNRCILPGITPKPSEEDKEADRKMKEKVLEAASRYKRKATGHPNLQPQCGNRYEGRLR